MSYSNGLLSSPTTSSTHAPPGTPGIGFKLTGDGNYDIDGKRLTNVSQPIDARDVATKAYIDGNKLDVVLRDGSQNMTGNLDMNNNKLTSLADSTDDNDAVNLKVLKEHTQFHQNNYHLQPSFQFFKNFGDRRKIVIGQPGNPNLLPADHFYRSHIVHHDPRLVAKEGFGSGFGGWAWSSIKMTNDKLLPGTYTAIFDIFTVNLLAGDYNKDETLISQVYGDDHYNIITFSHQRIDNSYTKAYIQFSSDGQAGQIIFQIRYYGSQYDKNIRFIVHTRVVSGKQSTSFNHSIFNVSDVDDNHEILYFENLNLNGNKINGLGDPVDQADAANKKYVDGENTKQNIAIADKASKSYVDNQIANVQIDTTPLLPRDGSRSMTGDLDMDEHHILSVKNLTDHKVDDAYSDIVKDLKSVVNKEYLNQNFLKIKGNDYDLNQRVIKNSAPHDDGSYDNNTLVSKAFVDAEIAKLPKPDTDVLKLDGSKSMTGNLNLGDNAIIGIRSSAVDNAALTVGSAKATYLSLLGNRSMQGILNMGGFAIKNIKPFVEDDSSQASSDAQKNDVINFGYFHTERGELKRLINELGYDALNRKDPDPMEDDIDMANHSIINLKDPQVGDNTYAATVSFVNKTVNDGNTVMSSLIDKKIKNSEIRSMKSIEKENVFKKVMDDDEFKEDDSAIHKVGPQNKDFHSINKKTYEFKIDYDPDEGNGEYSTRLIISLIYLPIGYYTMVYEMYIDNGLTVDEIDAVGDSIHVDKINSKIDGTNTRSIIQLHKSIIYPDSDDLNIDIKLKGKTDPQTTIYVVIYGVKGYVSDVSVNLWDRYYYINNTSLKFELPVDMNQKDITGVNKITTADLDVHSKIDMKGNKIIGVGDGTSNNDAVNKIQLDVKVATVNNKIIQIRNEINTILTSLTKLKYYYFTDQLKHKHANTVKFPAINSHPFSAVNNSEFLKIELDGHYQIIYTGFFIHDAQFIIHDDTNGNDLFVINLNGNRSWTPITINTVIPITVDNGFNYARIKMYLKKKNNLY